MQLLQFNMYYNRFAVVCVLFTCLTLFLLLLTLKMPSVCRPLVSRYRRHAVTMCGMPSSSSAAVALAISVVLPQDNESSRPGTLPAIRSLDIKLSHEPLCKIRHTQGQ